MTTFSRTALLPTVISLSDFNAIAIVRNDDNGTDWVLNVSTDVLAGIMQQMEIIEDFYNGEVDWVNQDGDLKNWTFTDFWDGMEESEQRQVLNTAFLEMAAMKVPSKPISILDFLDLNSVQQQQYVQNAVISTECREYRWIYEFSAFATGRTTYWQPVWGAQMAKVAKYLRKCVADETKENFLFERIEGNIAAYELSA